MQTVKPPLPETLAMANLSDEERNDLINAANNVVDLREHFQFAMRQRQLAASYRKGDNLSPPGPKIG